MSICLHHLGFGAVTALVAIAMGEVTSPLQNVWFMLKTWRYDSQLADSVFKHLSWVYAAFYFVCRSLIGTAVVRPLPSALQCSSPLPPDFPISSMYS
jgi:hypothetical protein